MKVAIIGAGAVGKLLAAYISGENDNVTLVCHSESSAMAINSRGIRVSGVRGNSHKIPKAVAGISDLSSRSKFDCIIFATKAFDLRSAATEALPYLAKNGIAISLQDGICSETLADIVGKRRTATAVLTFTCEAQNETNVKLTCDGHIYLGRSDKKIEEDIVRVRALLSSAFPTTVSDDIYEELYAKLALSSAVSAASIITGKPFAKLSRDRYARKFCNGIINEYMELAKKSDFTLRPLNIHAKDELIPPPSSFFARLRSTFIWIKLAGKYKNANSPSYNAFKKGKKTEIYYLNGWIARRAERYEIDIPFNSAAIRMISEIEKGKLEPARKNLKDIFRKR